MGCSLPEIADSCRRGMRVHSEIAPSGRLQFPRTKDGDYRMPASSAMIVPYKRTLRLHILWFLLWRPIPGDQLRQVRHIMLAPISGYNSLEADSLSYYYQVYNTGPHRPGQAVFDEWCPPYGVPSADDSNFSVGLLWMANPSPVLDTTGNTLVPIDLETGDMRNVDKK
ncbi:hypothetical protein PR048_001967 [Dryococelus australis]|uniref:Uncharacterized protein n=1 Tax=Dryococelus australis TaxID=614101 RepID=A0ABQ9IIV0_9NEOP|nr:hypothetical protein PR048_001967 [Dryococelus australis]